MRLLKFTIVLALSLQSVYNRASQVVVDPSASGSFLSTALQDSHIFVGNASDIATDVAVTGDISISNTGVVTIAAGAVSLTTDVTGILPIANGGTNNNAAYTAGSVIFSNGTSLIQDNANLFWDNSNNRLGLGNAAPSDTLHVTGTARVSSLGDGVVVSDANGVLSSVNPLPPSMGGTGAGALTSDRIVVTDGSGNLATNGSLTATRIPVADGTGSLTDDPHLTFDTTSNLLSLQGSLGLLGSASGTTTLTVPAAAGTYSLTLPSAVSSADDVMTFNGSGAASFAKIANANVAAGAGILVNKLAAQTASRLASYDASGFLQANGALTSTRIPVASGTGALADDAELTYNTATNVLGLQGTLNLLGSSSGTTSVTVPAAAGTYTLTIPSAAGAANSVLKSTAGSGTLDFGQILDANITGPISTAKLSTLTASRLVSTSAGGLLQVNNALTSGRVPYANGTGSLTDSSTFTFDGANLLTTNGTIIATGGDMKGLAVYALVKGNATDSALGYDIDKDTGFNFPSDNIMSASAGGVDRTQWDSTSFSLLTGYTLKLGGSSSGTTTFAVPAAAGNYTLTLPSATASVDDVMTFNGSSTASFAKIANANVASGAAIAVNKLAAQTASRVAVLDGSGFLTANANALTANRVTYASASGTLTDDSQMLFAPNASDGDETLRVGNAMMGGIPALTGTLIATWGNQALAASLGYAIAAGSDGVNFFNSSAVTPTIDFLSNFNVSAPNMRVGTSMVSFSDAVSSTSPTITWLNDTNTGFNRPTADSINTIIAGASVLRVDATGFNIGDGTAPEGIVNINKNSVEDVLFTGTVNTTTNAQTVCVTHTTASNAWYMLEGTVSARRTGGTAGAANDGAAYKFFAGAKNTAGTLALSGAVSAAHTSEDQAGWDATFTVSGTAVRVSVTGATDNNVTWDCELKLVRND